MYSETLTEVLENAQRSGKIVGAMFLIFGPILASAIRIPMMLQNLDSGVAVGTLVGWICGSLVSITLGVFALIRATSDRQ